LVLHKQKREIGLVEYPGYLCGAIVDFRWRNRQTTGRFESSSRTAPPSLLRFRGLEDRPTFRKAKVPDRAICKPRPHRPTTGIAPRIPRRRPQASRECRLKTNQDDFSPKRLTPGLESRE
jgi:hypothetical protein